VRARSEARNDEIAIVSFSSGLRMNWNTVDAEAIQRFFEDFPPFIKALEALNGRNSFCFTGKGQFKTFGSYLNFFWRVHENHGSNGVGPIFFDKDFLMSISITGSLISQKVSLNIWNSVGLKEALIFFLLSKPCIGCDSPCFFSTVIVRINNILILGATMNNLYL